MMQWVVVRTYSVSLSQRFDREKDEEAASIFKALLLLLEKASLGGEYIKEVRSGWNAETAVCRSV